MNTLKLRFSLFRIIVRWLAKVYLGLSAHNSLVEQWVSVVQKWAETRGTVWTIGRVKATRLAYTRFLARQPLSETPGFDVKLDTFGLPVGCPLRVLFESRDSTSIRLGLTALGLSRVLPGWKAPDLTPITTPGVPLSAAFAAETSGVVSELGWKLVRPVWDGCHVSTKSGPNAQAMVGSIEDASLLTESQIRDLEVLGGSALVRLIGVIQQVSPLAWLAKILIKKKINGKLTDVPLGPKGRQGRLSLIKDKEAKCRIVAILDYWTQSALRPLHDALMRHLKSLRPDCTFNQGSFRAKLSRTGPYYSYDLSSATDRFPVWLQVSVLADLVSSEYADAWRRLIIDRDYHVGWERRKSVTVRYACGQPMGAYSSWALFSTCHHVMVRLAAKRAGKPVSFSNYVLLGDDIVIGDHEVAAQYRNIMCELGVEISSMKSHVSDDTYEFAKRWIHVGEEVTGAPLGSFFEAVRLSKVDGAPVVPTSAIKYISFYGLATWLRELESRWLPRSNTLVSRGLLAKLFLLLGRGAQSERLADKAWKFFLLPVREDGRSLRRWKTRTLASILIGDILTCNSGMDAVLRVLVFLNECKARVLEEAIKRQVGRVQQFQLELPNYLDLVPEGLDAQSLLLSLPPIAAVIRNVRELQVEFDKAHAVRESDSMIQWLNLDVRLFLDPFESMSARKSKTVAISKATILNHLTAMCRGVVTLRNWALSVDLPHELDSSVEVLAKRIQTYEVLPRSGAWRKPRASKKVTESVGKTKKTKSSSPVRKADNRKK